MVRRLKKEEKISWMTVLKRTVFHKDAIGFALWIIIPALAFSLVSTAHFSQIVREVIGKACLIASKAFSRTA